MVGRLDMSTVQLANLDDIPVIPAPGCQSRALLLPHADAHLPNLTSLFPQRVAANLPGGPK